MERTRAGRGWISLEVAAMVLIDAIVRLLPGAIGAETGTADETFADGLIEYPQYTRPREFRGMAVPDVLLSGNHAAIAKWRQEQRGVQGQQVRQPTDHAGSGQNRDVPGADHPGQRLS